MKIIFRNIIFIINYFIGYRKAFKNKKLTKKQNSPLKYFYYLQILALILLIVFIKEPALNFMVFSGNYRKPNTEDWIFYAYKNKEMYAAQIGKRKILIVGGSNTLFGIDAKEIEYYTGIPTVNHGVHAGLGVDYILNRAKKILRPGDIALIALEFPLYHQSKNDQIIAEFLKNYIISYDRYYFNEFSFIDKMKMVLELPNINKRDFTIIKGVLLNKPPFDKKMVYNKILERVATGECYTGMSVDRNGDEMCNIGKLPTKDLSTQGKIAPDLRKPIDPSGSIRNFCRFANKHKITVIPIYATALLYPDYQTDKYVNYFYKIKNFWLKQNLLFEDSPKKSFLEYKMMFNTPYHPNERGRSLRTKNIISILNYYL